MLKIIHPRYAVKVMDKFIPDELLDEFVKEIDYYQQRESVLDSKFFSMKSSPLMYKLLSAGQVFVSKFNVRIMAVEYVIWRARNPIFMPHIDMTPTALNYTVDSDQTLSPIDIRLNVPVFSQGSILDWFEIKEDSTWGEGVRMGLDGNHDVLQIVEDAVPDYSISADDTVFVNPSIPHRINMKQTDQDRLSLSFKIKNKFKFEDFVKQIPEQYLK
jgi:hypothetical protein